MPDLANRADHEAALLAAIQPVFVSLAAQGAKPDWEAGKRNLVRVIEPVLREVDWQASKTIQFPGTTITPQASADRAHEQAVILAAELIATRKELWQAAREQAAAIETPPGEADISDEALMLYLLYGLPKRRPEEFNRITLMPIGVEPSPLARLNNSAALSDAWETHLAQYVPADGRGLVAEYLGPERAQSIAVTETTKANSRAEMAAAEDFERATGVRIVAYWVTEKDSRVCPTCEGLGGKAESVWLREFPDGPPAHPNCRCFLSWDTER